MRPDLQGRFRSSKRCVESLDIIRTLAQVVAFTANLAQISGAACTLLTNAPEPTVTTSAPPDVHEGKIVEGGELV